MADGGKSHGYWLNPLGHSCVHRWGPFSGETKCSPAADGAALTGLSPAPWLPGPPPRGTCTTRSRVDSPYTRGPRRFWMLDQRIMQVSGHWCLAVRESTWHKACLPIPSCRPHLTFDPLPLPTGTSPLGPFVRLSTVSLCQSGQLTPTAPLWSLKLTCHVFSCPDYLTSDNSTMFVVKATQRWADSWVFDGLFMFPAIHRYLVFFNFGMTRSKINSKRSHKPSPSFLLVHTSKSHFGHWSLSEAVTRRGWYPVGCFLSRHQDKSSRRLMQTSFENFRLHSSHSQQWHIWLFPNGSPGQPGCHPLGDTWDKRILTI